MFLFCRTWLRRGVGWWVTLKTIAGRKRKRWSKGEGQWKMVKHCISKSLKKRWAVRNLHAVSSYEGVRVGIVDLIGEDFGSAVDKWPPKFNWICLKHYITLIPIPYSTVWYSISSEFSLHVYYRSIPGKRPWTLYHNSLFFTTLGAYLVYWVLTMCKMYKISGWCQHTIAIVMATRLSITAS